MNEIEKFEHNGVTVKLIQDSDPTSPREWDNFATLACWHRRMNLGDKQISQMDEEELRETFPDIIAVLPLYCYEHGGITVSTGAYSCRFDSGQVGWAFVTKESAEAMGCVGPEWTEEKLQEAIKGEVANYAQFLEGQVFGYVIEDEDGNELDSLWGIFGVTDARDQGKAAAVYEGNKYKKEQAEEADRHATEEAALLAERATYAGPAAQEVSA